MCRCIVSSFIIFQSAMLVSSHLACAMEEPPSIQPQSSLAQRGGRGDAKETSAPAASESKYPTCCDTCGTLLTIDGGWYHANRRRDLCKSCHDGLPYWPSKKPRVEGSRSYRLVQCSGDLEEDKWWYCTTSKKQVVVTVPPVHKLHKFEGQGVDDPLEAERVRVEAPRKPVEAPKPAPTPAPTPTVCRGLCGFVAHANPDPKWAGYCCGCCRLKHNGEVSHSAHGVKCLKQMP